MPPDPLPQYTFVPWLRRGFAARIDVADRLGTQPDDGPAGRTPLQVSLALDYTPVGGPPLSQHLTAASRTVDILGPGDVGGIRREAIFRTCPEAGALYATPGELAAVEFFEEDFPWRYTPARPALLTEDAAKRFKLRPWIALFVLQVEPAEFTLTEIPGKLSILQIANGVELPPVTETWAWAHAQLSTTVDNPGGIPAAVAADTDRAISRLLSPRRLEPSRAYRAFVVPAFEAGRLAGLGLDASAAPTQKPSWGTPAQMRFPVYFDFTFTTDAEGSFETLARRLKPAPAGQQFGKRPMDVSAPGYGLVTSAGATVQLEGALAPLAFQRAPFSAQSTVAQDLEGILDLGERARDALTVPDDPIVVPPAYGRWHAGVLQIADATNPASTAEAVRLAWLAELNLDLRNRAAAGLGNEVVRQRQDELMERAWQQVGNLRAANQQLREAELAQTAGDKLFQKHVAAAGGPERVLILTGAAHSGLVAGSAGTTSVRGAIDASRVPAAAQTAAFRRFTRPQRPAIRRLTGDRNVRRFQTGLITGMNADPDQALSTAPPRPDPPAAAAFQDVSTEVTAAVTELAAEEQTPKRIFLDLVRTELATRRAAGQTLALPAGSVPLQGFLAAVSTALAARLPATPVSNTPIRQRVQVLVDAIVVIAPDGTDAAIVTIPKALFNEEYGDGIAGKSYRGVTFVPDQPAAAGTTVSKATGIGAVQEFAASLTAFNANVLGARPLPPPLPALASPTALANHVLDRLTPRRALGERVTTRMHGLRQTLASRPANAPRPLRPVMAYPTFRDPLFEMLRTLSQDYIIPNISDLPRESLTLMQPNTRFIEAFLAGANHAFAQELLWREYPTDRRGTYFRVFWDTRDALAAPDRNDINVIPSWTGPLGTQSPLPPNVLVLVVRGALLEKFPDTVIYAQEAAWPGGDTSRRRILAPTGAVRHPIFHARLDPDIVIVGFDLNAAAARGHRPVSGDPTPARPGWFIVFMERPGQPRFGMDDAPPADLPPGELPNWNDLSWTALTPPNSRYIQIAANAGLTPTNPQAAAFGKSAADMAAILYQSPVLLARHASEMLP